MRIAMKPWGWLAAVLLAAVLALAASAGAEEEGMGSGLPEDSEALYMKACSACHGPGGTGADPEEFAFDVLPPDFTECNFASREPTQDWYFVVAEGGPARGFSEFMPAFGDAMTIEQIDKTLRHVHSLCGDDDWPRGELNLPRPLVTTKAYPEDELVVELEVDDKKRQSTRLKAIYEKRIGPRFQLEAAVPYEWREQDDQDWESGVSDATLGAKLVAYSSLEYGSIVSPGLEVVIPTGEEKNGLGGGVTKLEPYLAWGQIWPLWDVFTQAQVGYAHVMGNPSDRDVNDEWFWRTAVGRTFTFGRYGRAVTPMVEFVGQEEIGRNTPTEWDVVPQVQIPLNRRQHVRLGLGVRYPLNNYQTRDHRYMAYLLWDWFDGGFFEGW